MGCSHWRSPLARRRIARMVAGKHHTAEFLYRIGGPFPISGDLEAVSGGISSPRARTTWTLDFAFDADAAAHSYEVEISVDPVLPTSSQKKDDGAQVQRHAHRPDQRRANV